MFFLATTNATIMQAGHVAGHDQADDRGTGQNGVDDQDAGGRADQTGRSGSDVRGSGELLVIAGSLLLGEHDAADGDGRGDRRTGQRAEHGVADNVGVGQTARDAADEGLCEVNEFLRDAAGVHQNAGQDEEGNGEQREAVNAGNHLLAGNEGGKVDRQGSRDRNEGRNDQGHGDRDAQREHQEEAGQQQQTDLYYTHVVLSSRITWRPEPRRP